MKSRAWKSAKPIPASIGKPEEPELVVVRRDQGEPEPAKRQGKGDQAGKHDPPEDRHVHGPAQEAALPDERLTEDVVPPRDRDQEGVAAKVAPGEEVQPARLEVAPGGRPSDPEGIAVDHRRQREDRSDRVADQRRVKVPEVARAEVDQEHQRSRRHGGDCCRR